jgi:hypothetical protein
VGTIPGQPVNVLNESSFSVTFATAATSHVTLGATCSVAAQTHTKFVWDSVTSFWYPLTFTGGSAAVQFLLSGGPTLAGLSVSGSIVGGSVLMIVGSGIIGTGTIGPNVSAGGQFGVGLLIAEP